MIPVHSLIALTGGGLPAIETSGNCVGKKLRRNCDTQGSKVVSSALPDSCVATP